VAHVHERMALHYARRAENTNLHLYAARLSIVKSRHDICPRHRLSGQARYPPSPGAHPTGAIGALTHWQAGGIINRYLKHPDTLIT
jgi:hypothetical protein